MLLKIVRKIKISFKIMTFKLIYGKNLKIKRKLAFKDGFSIIIENRGMVEIGSNCFFNNYCSINCLKKIIIGNNCIFGENIKIYDHNHIFNQNTLISKSGYNVNEIYIGNNCWIGSNVVILKGVHIGNNCVIGAGVVLDKNIEDNSIVHTNRELIIEKIRKK